MEIKTIMQKTMAVSLFLLAPELVLPEEKKIMDFSLSLYAPIMAGICAEDGERLTFFSFSVVFFFFLLGRMFFNAKWILKAFKD